MHKYQKKTHMRELTEDELHKVSGGAEAEFTRVNRNNIVIKETSRADGGDPSVDAVIHLKSGKVTFPGP